MELELPESSRYLTANSYSWNKIFTNNMKYYLNKNKTTTELNYWPKINFEVASICNDIWNLNEKNITIVYRNKFLNM